jgi:hypothetical protein
MMDTVNWSIHWSIRNQLPKGRLLVVVNSIPLL